MQEQHPPTYKQSTYKRLECGIVIRLNADGTSDWPYGPRKGNDAAKLVDAMQEEFDAQAAAAWQLLPELLEQAAPLLDFVDTDIYDAAFSAIGYAILTYDDSRGASLRTYALKMARFAINAMRAKIHASLQPLEEHQGAENFIGQIDANVDIYKYRDVLSREQWQLLLSRYDSYLSFDEIAREFGYSSRTTAHNKIEAALDICRRVRNSPHG